MRFSLDFLHKSLKSAHFRLGLKAVIFGLGLLIFHGFWGIILILAISLLLYSRPSHHFIRHWKFFCVFVITAIVTIAKFRVFAMDRPDMPLFFWIYLLAAGFLGFLFYLLLGIKNLSFIHRKESYYFLTGCLLLMIFSLLFSADRTGDFLLKSFIAVSGVYLVFRESFDLFTAESNGLRVSLFKSSTAAIFSLLLFQGVWGISLLPIGFINSASLVLLFVLVLEDLAINHWEGTLTRRLMLRDASLFMFAVALIFAGSKWVL